MKAPRIIKTGDQEANVKMLLYGKTGSGKTYTSTHLDEKLWGKVLFVNFETKDLSAKPGIDQVRVGSEPTRSREELGKIYEWLLAGDHGYGTVVLDGMTEYGENLMDEIKSGAKKLTREQKNLLMVDADLGIPSYGAWGQAGDRLRGTFKKFKALPVHLIATASEDWDKDNKLSQPMFYGRTKAYVGHYFSFVGRMEPTTGEEGEAIYTIRFAASDFVYAKAEGSAVDDVEPADLNAIYTKIYGQHDGGNNE